MSAVDHIAENQSGQNTAAGAQQVKRYIWLSIVAALVTITLKMIAWRISGSVGLLSDAMESFVNLFSALFALVMLRIAYTPPDEQHPFGHSKAEYFASVLEGAMIFIAAGLILYTAIPRLFQPAPLEALNIGLIFSVVSTALNFAVAQVLIRAGKRLNSIALRADGRHLMTDVWTTAGIVIGLIAVLLTGWLWLDALLAIGVAFHILSEGYKLMKESVNGLMDRSLSEAEIQKIEQLLQTYAPRHVLYTHLKTRVSGSQRFVLVNILVPADWQVGKSHDLLDEIEAKISQLLGGANVSTHLEPIVSTDAAQPSLSKI